MYKNLNINKKRLFFFLAMSLGYFCGTSQDIHNSQFWLYPINLNPAAAGFFDGNLRFGAYNRTQWRSITPQHYQTVGISADMPLVKRPWKQDIVGFGIAMNYDQTGDSRYATSDGNLMLSYARALNSRSNNFLMGGISVGCVQRSWDYTRLSFDEQYVDGFYDPKSPISETFTGSNIWYFDCGAGLQWFYQPDFLTFYQAGFSIYHLNRPEISMLSDKTVRLNVKFAAHVISSIAIGDKKAIIPAFYMAFQNQHKEILFGATYLHQLPLDARGFLNNLNVGLFYRWNDAIYVCAGMDFRRCRFSVSYDFNVSHLIPASRVRGGVELGVSYVFKKKTYIKRQQTPCAVFD